METGLLNVLLIGLALILIPSVMGARYLSEMRSESCRMKSRFRELE